MRLVFKTMHIESFLSLGVVDLDLSNSGYTLVTGENQNQYDSASSNGSGKSSLFEAIVWCLTGTTMRGSKDVCNIRTSTGALVELEVQIDNDVYKICRSKDHVQYKTNLRIFKNNEDVSGKGIRDSEKLLAEYIPDLTSELLGSVIVLGQGLPSRFTRNSPSGRKDTLEKLSKSDFMIEDLKERVATRKTKLGVALRAVQDDILACKTQLNSINLDSEVARNTLTELNNSEDLVAIVSDLHQKLDELQREVSEVSKIHETSCENAYKLLRELDELRSTKELYTNRLTSDMRERSAELRVKQAELEATRRVLISKINQVKSMSDICPTCGQKLHDVVIPSVEAEEMELESLLQQLTGIQEQLNFIETQYKTDLDSYISSIRERDKELNETYRAEATRAAELMDELGKLRKQANSCEEELKSKQFLQKTIEFQRTDLEERLSRYESSNIELTNKIEDLLVCQTDIQERQATISKFETILKRDFRGELLNNVITYIQDVSQVYAQDIFDSPALEFKLDGNNIVIKYDGREYENLSGGERQKVDLVVQFALREMLCTFLNFNSSILVLDEIFDNLDAVGSQKVNDMLARRLTGIDSVFIISHHAAELNIPVDKTITIVKDANGVSNLA